MKTKLIIGIDQMMMGGVETVLLTLMRGLLKTQQYDISLLVTHYLEEGLFADFFAEGEVNLVTPSFIGVKPKNIMKKIFWKARRGCLRWYDRSRRRTLCKQGDLLIDFKNGCMDREFSRIKSKPKILWIHCSFLFVQEQMNVDFSHYTKVVLLTNRLKEQMKRTYPLLEKEFIQLYNPFDFSLIRAQGEDVDGLSQDDIGLIEAPYFLHIGRLHPDKDITTLLEAYEQFLGRAQSSIRLYLLGDGDLRVDYQNMVIEKGLESQVLFLGNRHNPHIWTKRAKALVLSSPSEGLPCVLIESMILGTLTISSDCPDGPAEILEHGKCGVLFEPSNAEQLAQILVDVEGGRLRADQFLPYTERSVERFNESNIQQQVNTLIADCLK